MALKGLVKPILEYANPVWDPSEKTLQDELEKVQNRAARFVTGNYVPPPPKLGGDVLFLPFPSILPSVHQSVRSVVCQPSHFLSAQYLENHLSQSLHISHGDWSL